MNLTYDLAALAARAEISDVICRFCHAVDRHRWALMAHVFHDDATVKYSFRAVVQPYAEWVAKARATMAALGARDAGGTTRAKNNLGP